MVATYYTKSALAVAALLATVGFMAEAQTRNERPALSGAATTTDSVAIMGVISSYETALNASNTDAVMSLYAEDGVFMPPYSQSAVGAGAVRQVYDAGFKAITLHVKFDIAELVEISPDWAFVRTNSTGTTIIKATGARNAEGNHELFIFKKGTDGTWKIARYSFSSTNPPPRQ